MRNHVITNRGYTKNCELQRNVESFVEHVKRKLLVCVPLPQKFGSVFDKNLWKWIIGRYLIEDNVLRGCKSTVTKKKDIARKQEIYYCYYYYIFI